MVSAADAEGQHSTPAPAAGPAVKDLVGRARKARKLGKWNEAYDAYKAAFDAAEAVPSAIGERAELAGELGLCELALRKYREAAEHLTWSLEQGHALTDDVRIRFEVGQAKAAFYLLRVLLSVDPPDAEVFINGKAIGRTARTYKLFLDPGRHMLRARAPGREEALHVVSASAGSEIEIAMQLPRLSVSSIREAPAAPEAASASPAARPQASSPWASWPGALRITGIGLTVATGSLGAAFMVRASAADGDLDERNKRLDAAGVSPGVCREPPKPATCSELTRLRRERDLFAGLGTAMVVTSGLAGAATLASFFADSSFLRTEPTKARLALMPTVTPARLGLVAYGAW
ncbi:MULTISPECIES: PEGA domain-containing protein [Sorangium]|uniref:PEGA domain-containing protein n=1 Tax=Sorangium TaxID=39643 RepID=UPI002D1E4B3B|nr:PEGA domain-containing protein [Sorangium sp. Soce836]